MYTYIHNTYVFICTLKGAEREKDTCEFWYNVNQTRCNMEKSNQLKNISAARNVQVFRFRNSFA